MPTLPDDRTRSGPAVGYARSRECGSGLYRCCVSLPIPSYVSGVRKRTSARRIDTNSTTSSSWRSAAGGCRRGPGVCSALMRATYCRLSPCPTGHRRPPLACRRLSSWSPGAWAVAKNLLRRPAFRIAEVAERAGRRPDSTARVRCSARTFDGLNSSLGSRAVHSECE